ncbi:MAG: hypothetical protein KatS3mg129_2351 [Leptospiraceae bacterium]|nr:MAG: hypothetical protein KatS3mg129_2351 [Leptospiraceae bacterium]
MEYYFIRHGIAEDNKENDLERKLTKEGTKKVKDIANIVTRIFPEPNFILTSEALRSIETAKIFSKKWKVKKMDSYSKLNPGASIYDYLFIIGAYLNKDIVRSDYRIALITHEPDLSYFAAALLENHIKFDFKTEEIYYDKEPILLNFHLKKSSLMIIEWDGEESNLKFYSPPSIFKKLKNLIQ